MSRAPAGARLLATWFGCGFVPVAPGTAGTLGALPLYWLAAQGGRAGVAFAAGVVGALGVWSASHVEREVGAKDPPIVVIDEVAGMLVTMLPVASPSWRAIAVGFVLFRLLDTFKPWPVRLLERLPSGWGIVLDDVAAGAVGAVVMIGLHAVRAIP